MTPTMPHLTYTMPTISQKVFIFGPIPNNQIIIEHITPLGDRYTSLLMIVSATHIPPLRPQNQGYDSHQFYGTDFISKINGVC